MAVSRQSLPAARLPHSPALGVGMPGSCMQGDSGAPSPLQVLLHVVLLLFLLYVASHSLDDSLPAIVID